MANTLSRIYQTAQIYLRQAPLVFAGLSDPNDFVFLAGDWVRQFMLAPPFAWRWNRATTTFTTVAGTQDYTESLATFGWLEKATITDNAQAPAVTNELTMKLNLGEETVQNQPVDISPRLDNGAGQITFRLFPVPDKTYTVTVTYQNSAASFANLTDTWLPIPDYMSYLYMQGFLAKAYEYFADERFGTALQLFIKQLVAANAGLNETQVNIFLDTQLNSARQKASDAMNTQLGDQGRAL